MKKTIFRLVLAGLLLFGIIGAYKHYQQHKEEQRRAAYYENLKDSASPTVTVLRDSIMIAYQNQKRTLHVYVPPDYARDSVQRFPVIYFLDGESAFNDLENESPEWQIDEVINAAAKMGEQTAIVVGINQAADRDAEYTPFVNEDNPKAHGAAFATWVALELKPWIDSNYRTEPEAAATTIGGISRSGMMAYYMLMAHPDVFGNALIQSPAMWVDYDRLMAMQVSKSQLKGKKIMITVGEREGRIMIPHAQDIFKKFKSQDLSDTELRFEIIPGEGHWNITWRKSFALAYPWLMDR